MSVPDVIELLNHDHREVEKLFAQFERSQSWDTVVQICQELEVHTQVEEEIVYPPLASIDGKLEREAEKEHDEAKQLIAKIRRGGENASGLMETVTKLKEAVEHHVQEEESEAWPKMRDELGQSQLNELGTQVKQRKQELLSNMSTSGSGGRGGRGGGRFVDLTKEELYEKAKEANIEGRSSMTKDELADALQRQG
jgi:iron-sulfur cluster repair protein YtfE (RIC family)